MELHLAVIFIYLSIFNVICLLTNRIIKYVRYSGSESLSKIGIKTFEISISLTRKRRGRDRKSSDGIKRYNKISAISCKYALKIKEIN